MSKRFEELDWQQTPMGEVTLRRRFDLVLGTDVFEAILNDEHLMSTHFTVAEIELAHLGLAALEGRDLDVLVGGLGLGYTAQAVLEHENVRSLTVVEAIDVVVDWHRRALLPISAALTADPRLSIEIGDFFARMRDDQTPRVFDAIIVDIDHSPSHHLHPSHAPFYTEAGIQAMRRHLAPGGVFALWSDDAPDAAFTAVLAGVFEHVQAEVVAFDNALTGGRSANSVYVAH
ncbi:spermidine synthase [Microbacterium sp. W4I4]|uniref:spermidine synthase n=1 Tax=Microbacterium sp. W4I4 TaxID=3042295 RepID=UPI0027898855|nr:spermidine synthase [Microbacterium sp. W4I4]MDQ0612779.1 spermidine synthase [Microbacterium sp. W4I4]